jgi:hypothetical protein
MKAINLLKKVISCTPDKLSNTQRLTMSGLIFALDFKTFGGQTSRLKISCLSGLSIPTTNRNMTAFLRMGLISQQRRNKTIKTVKGDIRREIEPYIKINVERLIEYIENDQSEHTHDQSEHTRDQSEHTRDQAEHTHDQAEHTRDQSEHSNDQAEHSNDQADTPYTALYTDYNTDLFTVNNTANTHARKRRKQHASAWCDLEKQKEITQAWSDLQKKGAEK